MSETDFVDSTSLKASLAATLRPVLWHFEEHNIAEGVLGIVSETDANKAVFDAHPLVVFGVSEFVGMIHY